jgi:hypothetical protein
MTLDLGTLAEGTLAHDLRQQVCRIDALTGLAAYRVPPASSYTNAGFRLSPRALSRPLVLPVLGSGLARRILGQPGPYLAAP